MNPAVTSTVPLAHAIVPAVPLSAAAVLDVRPARVGDAQAIHDLISSNLAAGHLLPRTLSEIAIHASRFAVVVRNSQLVACGELAPLSPGVAEVRSLVVQDDERGLGVGRRVIEELRRRARAGRYRTLCAFTHDPRFFVRLGFSIVPHFWLPEKVAADCWSCPLFQKCGQYAMIDTLSGSGVVRPAIRELVS
ncbi:MAG: GNAT family N-acetyltransferase [Acidobacteriota bacterium]